jgi:two-component system response regulator WspF
MNVAIVNDSKAATEVLRRILAAHPGFDLLWTAFSGEEALRLCAISVPDIILMDLIMPGIDGAETTRRIMQSTPCVILIVTATTVGNRDKVFEAMGYGALDAVNTPNLHLRGEMSGAEPLLQKLRTVGRLVSPPRPGPAPHTHSSQSPIAKTSSHHSPDLAIVAIGASTGGPQALSQILSHLPADFPAAVLVGQHVDEQFAPGLANWLQHHTALPVRIACAGQPLTSGTVWIAGSNDHLIYEERAVAGGTKVGFLNYTADPRDTAYRPSVDVLFASIAQPHRALRIGVLLTGMGRDGAEGLLALRNTGGLTIAQDAVTSVVYGMPKAAAELKAAAEILPLEAIGPRIHKAIVHSAHSQGLIATHQQR